MSPRKKPNLSLSAKSCISKNVACFSKLCRLMPYFSKCKICIQTQICFFTQDMSMHKNQFILKIHAFFLFTFKYIVEKNAFPCKKLKIIRHKSIIQLKNLCIHLCNYIDRKKSYCYKPFDFCVFDFCVFDFCVFVCTVTYCCYMADY